MNEWMNYKDGKDESKEWGDKMNLMTEERNKWKG